MDIFSPVRLGALELANRIVMAPMTRDRAGPGDVPTGLMVEYYRQRASAGLIVTEGTQPSRVGKGYWRTPGIHSDAQVAGWRAVADAVHGAGGRIVMQLMHVGRAAVAANKDADAETVAPSAIASAAPIAGPDGTLTAPVMPRALETAEIAGVVEEFAQAARNARAAGIDGVELHCTSGYLPMQFLSPGSNKRTDRYGGSAANRVRFAVEVLEAMAAAIGADRVGFRIFPGNPYNDMADDNPAETYATLIDAAEPLGLAYLHLIHYPTPELDALALLRPRWSGAIIANNALKLDSAQALLDAGQVDAVSFGRPFISNPDLVERFRAGAPLTREKRDLLYTGEEAGYTDYPRWKGENAA
ncbi:alkene reductase [Sphingomonas jatrophae]|uniref:N-ethylmaleimide reductase n=1 Tax=Sphingomonas jatrophae TaxID=1166337 RepID=A0A1I6KI57_9SPHN|nr:alkene reductase [Sphingomonas jatrophae]SFR90891.1 N-ethylmaleimide reductase [Sphingomonas jatrophae]